jgi:hypothetical protein
MPFPRSSGTSRVSRDATRLQAHNRSPGALDASHDRPTQRPGLAGKVRRAWAAVRPLASKVWCCPSPSSVCWKRTCAMRVWGLVQARCEQEGRPSMAYRLEGSLLEICNCHVLCPCWIREDPDYGACDSAFANRFDTGTSAIGAVRAQR